MTSHDRAQGARSRRSIRRSGALTALAAIVSTPLILTAIAEPARAATSTYVVPASIPVGCTPTSPDVTGLLQNFVDSVPDDSIISFPAQACYRVEGQVEFSGRSDLTIEGNGSTLRSFTNGEGFTSNPYTLHHIFCYGGSDLTFTGLNIVGSDAAHTYDPNTVGQAGWWVWGTQGINIVDDTVTNVYGDFVTVGPNTYRNWQWADNVTISGDTFNGSGRQGITLTGAENVTISDNTISNAADSAIDIEPDSGTGPAVGGVPTYGGAANVTITNNVVGPSGTTFVSNDGAAAEVTNIDVSDNKLVDEAMMIWSTGYAAVPRTNWTIADNTSNRAFGSPRGAIELSYVDGASIYGNTVPFYAPENMTAVKVWGCDRVSVSSNDFPGATTIVAVDPPAWSGARSQLVSATANRGQIRAGTRLSAGLHHRAIPRRRLPGWLLHLLAHI